VNARPELQAPIQVRQPNKTPTIQAVKLCLERILPPVKSRPISFKLPELHTIADAQSALSAIIAAGRFDA
jgi:hypothetical protein